MTPKRPTNAGSMRGELIATCGMNCRLCRAYSRDKKPCPGCGSDDSYKPKSCVACQIKNCEKIANAEAPYCFNCDSFSCTRLKNLDKRYRTRYGMSMIDNLENIRKYGLEHFLATETERWTCPQCGAILCVHDASCLSCQRKWR